MSEPLAPYTARAMCPVCHEPLTLCNHPTLFEGTTYAYTCGRCEVSGPYVTGTDRAYLEYIKRREGEDEVQG